MTIKFDILQTHPRALLWKQLEEWIREALAVFFSPAEKVTLPIFPRITFPDYLNAQRYILKYSLDAKSIILRT